MNNPGRHVILDRLYIVIALAALAVHTEPLTPSQEENWRSRKERLIHETWLRQARTRIAGRHTQRGIWGQTTQFPISPSPESIIMRNVRNWELSSLSPNSAQALPHYDVFRAASKIVIDARLDDPAWQNAPPVGDFHFNRWKEGEKEQTVVRMLWDDESLYVGYLCHDRHISAYEAKRHGPVSKDDCVEIFLSPNPSKVTNYYTFEINAIGTMLNRCKADWWKGPPTWEPQGVRYRTSFHGWTRKEESPADTYWIVELAIPFHNFARDAAHTPPRHGNLWRLNLNRTGGITNPQSSTWSPLAPPATSFHTPESFGWVQFVNRRSPGVKGALRFR